MDFLRKLDDFIHRHDRIEESLRALWQVLAESGLLSTTISRMNAGFERWLLAFFGLKLNPKTSMPLLTNGISTREWKRRIQLASELEMPWDDSLREDQQRAAYIAHIGRVLDEFEDENRKHFAHDVSGINTALDTATRERPGGMPMLPFELRGTTDVLIESIIRENNVRPQPSPVLDGMLQNTRVVLQVKKPPIARYSHCMCQSTGELFAADLKAAAPIVAVLTDLANAWTFQWLAVSRRGKQVLHRAHFTKKKDGLKALASVLKITVEELNESRSETCRWCATKAPVPRDQRLELLLETCHDKVPNSN